jgi:hypothetical protein
MFAADAGSCSSSPSRFSRVCILQERQVRCAGRELDVGILYNLTTHAVMFNQLVHWEDPIIKAIKTIIAAELTSCSKRGLTLRPSPFSIS